MAKIILIIFLIYFSVVSFDLFSKNSKELVKNIPAPKTYRSDEFIFLRTFYLVKDNLNYYSAFLDATKNDSRGGYLTKDVMMWRLPTVFYFWKFIAPSGVGVGLLFIFLSALSLICVYKITNNILSPIILAPYYLDAFYYQTSFLFTEWWGLFFFIFGLTALLKNKSKLTIILLSLAVLTRELFLIPVIFMAIISFILKTNRLIFLKILFIVFVFYTVHYMLVQQQNVPSVSSIDIFSRLHAFNYPQFQKSIAFSMRQYPLLNFRLPLIFAIITPLVLLFKKKFYLLAAISPLFITSFMGTEFNDYWGIVFMPLVISFILVK